MGAIYTQIGAKQDRSTTKGLDAAVDNFLRAAGTFRYIHENFTNAPSMDLGPNMLEMIAQLMLVSKMKKLQGYRTKSTSASCYFGMYGKECLKQCHVNYTHHFYHNK